MMNARSARSRTAISWVALFFASMPLACSTPNDKSDENVGSTSEAYIETQCVDASTVPGIDVSSAQGAINWKKVRAGVSADGGVGDGTNGRQFAFIKATQGDYETQSTFKTYWAEAADAGVLRSAYHFFDPTIDGVTQANWFLDEVGPDLGELPAMLDVECPVSSDQATADSTTAGQDCEYGGGTPDDGWADSAAISSGIFDWLTTVEAATGRKPIIYSYPSWFASVGVTDARLADYPLYIASYGSCSLVPAPWTTALFWQYSGSGTVPGVPTLCDEDRFFGTSTDLTTYAFGPPDAGTPTNDAGLGGVVPTEDGGVATGDGGVSVTASGDSGCSCESVGGENSSRSGGVVVFSLLGITVVSRRSRRRKRSAC